ncbi:MAG: IS4 family transposase [Planctomycetota bacterium]|mgnify:FL=1
MGTSSNRTLITTFCTMLGEVEVHIRRRRVWCSRSIIAAILMLTRSGARGGYRRMLATFVDDTAELLGWVTSPSAASLSRARKLLPVDSCRALLRQLVDRIASSSPRRFVHPSGRRFIAIDGTQFIMPHTRQTLEQFDRPQAGAWVRAHHPQAVTVVAADLLKRLPLDWVLLPKGIGEREGARRLLDLFQPGDVAVLDRGYPSRAFLAQLLERKIAVVMRLPAGPRSWREAHEFLRSGQQETVCNMPLPDGATARIRLIRRNFRTGRPRQHQKAKPMVIVTTLTQEDGFSPEDIIRLYQARWGVETLLREIKVGFDLERFHARSLIGIEQEIAAVLIWIALGSTVEHAAEDGLPPGRRVYRTLCHDAATRIFTAWLAGRDPLERLNRELEAIRRYHYAPRPGRSFPRERKAPHGRFRNGTH